MLERAALVAALMRAFPPDMQRNDYDVDNDACIQRACYSTSQLTDMLGDPDVVSALCRANDGDPMWTASVRNFLLGYYRLTTD